MRIFKKTNEGRQEGWKLSPEMLEGGGIINMRFEEFAKEKGRSTASVILIDKLRWRSLDKVKFTGV